METFMNLMVSNDDPTPSPLAPVATLAFIDLETTGLPFDVGKNNVQITELSIVAIDRTDFEEDSCLRIANKINLYIRPRVPMSCGAMAVTGLYNDLLERQKPFDSTISEMLTLFFKRLRSPICLLAHNGDRFDFPVLQAELKRLSLSLPIDITCADTLVAFRSAKLLEVDTVEQQPAEEENIEYSVRMNGVTDEQLPAEGRKIEALVKINGVAGEQLPAEEKKVEALAQTNGVTIEEDDRKTATNFNYEKLLNDDMHIFEKVDDYTVTDNELEDQLLYALPQEYGQKTPIKRDKIHNAPSLNYKNKISKQNRYLIQPKKLYNDQTRSSELAAAFNPSNKSINISPTKNSKRPSYTLGNLYMHFFGKEAEGCHQALSDCLNLGKICQKVSSRFLPWIDENQRLFANVKAMW